MDRIKTLYVNYLVPFSRNFSSKHIAYICTFIGLVICIIFVIVISSRYCIGGDLTSDDMAQTGQVGDFIGGVVGSVWALAGVFLYFSAIQLQTKELSRQSLSENENRYSEQIKQLENTFFNLLNIQQDIKQNLSSNFRDIKYNGRKLERSFRDYSGNDFFDYAQRDLRLLYNFQMRESFSVDDINYINNISHPYDEATAQYVMENILINDIVKDMHIREEDFNRIKGQPSELDICKAVYFYYFLYYAPSIGHYCRHLYNILKYIDTSKRDIIKFICRTYEKEERMRKITDLNKRIRCYIAFLQSSLSISELIILFYNSLVYTKARKLYIKYQLLENLHDSALFMSYHNTMVSGYNFKSTTDLANSIFRV